MKLLGFPGSLAEREAGWSEQPRELEQDSRDAHPSSPGSAATGFTPVTPTIARPSAFKCFHSTELAIELLQRNVLLSFLLHHSFLRVSKLPAQQAPTNSRHKHPLRACTGNSEPGTALASRKGLRLDLEEPFRGGLGARGEPAPLRRRSAPPGARGAAPGAPPSRLPALTGQNGLAAAAQRQPGEGQDGGEGGRLHRQRPPGRAALAGGSPGSPGVAGGREERKVREAEALQHVSCKCAPARCRVADEGSYYQPCDRKG